VWLVYSAAEDTELTVDIVSRLDKIRLKKRLLVLTAFRDWKKALKKFRVHKNTSP